MCVVAIDILIAPIHRRRVLDIGGNGGATGIFIMTDGHGVLNRNVVDVIYRKVAGISCGSRLPPLITHASSTAAADGSASFCCYVIEIGGAEGILAPPLVVGAVATAHDIAHPAQVYGCQRVGVLARVDGGQVGCGEGLPRHPDVPRPDDGAVGSLGGHHGVALLLGGVLAHGEREVVAFDAHFGHQSRSILPQQLGRGHADAHALFGSLAVSAFRDPRRVDNSVLVVVEVLRTI